MRKDVRIGAVIGGILIAVMVAYAVFSPKNHSDKKKDPVVLDLGKSSGSTEQGTGTNSDPLAALTHMPLPGSVDTAAPATPGHADESQATPAAPAPAPASGSEGRTTNWGALLSADRVEDVMPVKTRTPTPAKPEADAAVPAPVPPAADAPAHSPEADAPAKPADAPADSHTRTSEAGNTHKVASGETLSSIAQAVYGNAKYYKEIAKANPKVDSSHLKIGTVIVLPDKAQVIHEAAAPAAPASTGTNGADSTQRHTATAPPAPINTATQYRVQSNDNLYAISMKLYHSPNKMDAIYQLNKTLIGPDPARLKLNMVLQIPEPPTQTASR